MSLYACCRLINIGECSSDVAIMIDYGCWSSADSVCLAVSCASKVLVEESGGEGDH